MNERIKELARQARILSDQFQEQWKAGPSSEEFFQEKFAELIVGECTRILADNSEFRSCVIISKHFKVEEEWKP